MSIEQPYLKYADPAKNLKNTPYPFADELTEITDDDVYESGDTLPYVYFDRTANGRWGASRDDITGKMAYKDGYWTVEMGRKTGNGNVDDIQFKPRGQKAVWFVPMVRTDGVFVRPGTQARLIFATKGAD